MRFLGEAETDVGISRTTNQDAVCIKVARMKDGNQAAMAVICDGMGGLAKGELASATVIRRFSDWFEQEFPKEYGKKSLNDISAEWDRMLKELNVYILEHGKKIGANLGTTASAVLFLGEQCLIVHIGDSRIYEIKNQVEQLTEDQTYVHREVVRGNITPVEAKTHPKRNVLLQCIGASKAIAPQIIVRNVVPESVFMLCSDGFRHVITEEEIFERFRPGCLSTRRNMKQNSRYLIDLVKQRNEKDNITVALLKCF